MENNKKLELTLCDFANKGLTVQLNEKGLRELWDIDEDTSHLQDVYFIKSIDFELKLIQLTSTKDARYILDEIEFDWVILLLHSLDKLTEPILENGLIPIVELAKICDGDFKDWKVKGGICLHENLYFKYHKEAQSFSYWCEYNGQQFVKNQNKLFEWLKEWHFNLYDLPKELFIEKSTQNH